MSIITLIISVYLANGTPIVQTFTVPTQEHCSQERAKQYIEYFILPALAPGQQIQKTFGAECITTEAIAPSQDLIPLPQVEPGPRSDAAHQTRQGLNEMTRCTVSGKPAVNEEKAPVPNSERRADGQHVDHWVLCETERAKGFLRPLRHSYVHVGPPGPEHPLRELTDDEKAKWAHAGYVKFEVYPESESPKTGRYWTQEQLDKIGKGCGTVTRMPHACAETYARQPGYYGSTFCCGCGTYLKVGADGEFVWDGTNERVGT